MIRITIRGETLMNSDNTSIQILGLIGAIALGVFTNLLTSYFFPDGGKTLLKKLFFILSNTLGILLIFLTYIVLFLFWMVTGGDIVFSALLGLFSAINAVRELYIRDEN